MAFRYFFTFCFFVARFFAAWDMFMAIQPSASIQISSSRGMQTYLPRCAFRFYRLASEIHRLVLRIHRRLQSISPAHSSTQAARTPVREPPALQSVSLLHSSPRASCTPVHELQPNRRGLSLHHGGKGSLQNQGCAGTYRLCVRATPGLRAHIRRVRGFITPGLRRRNRRVVAS